MLKNKFNLKIVLTSQKVKTRADVEIKPLKPLFVIVTYKMISSEQVLNYLILFDGFTGR